MTHGCIAQLVEQLTLNQWVWGSSPHAPTKNSNRLYADFNFCIEIFLLASTLLHFRHFFIKSHDAHPECVNITFYHPFLFGKSTNSVT